MIISCNTIVDRRDHVQYMIVSESYSDNCTCSFTERDGTISIPPGAADSSSTDSSPTDSSPTDSSPTDSSPTDSSPTYSSPTDSSPTDSSPTDSSPTDSSETQLRQSLTTFKIIAIVLAGVYNVIYSFSDKPIFCFQK